MARNNNRGRNNNPSGRNQYSGDWMDTVKERPIAAAAVAAASVGAGVFLWSKRNQISNQLSSLSDQISDWTENMRLGEEGNEFEMADSSPSGAATGSTSARTSRSTGSRPTATKTRSGRGSRGMSETGGGNASLGGHTGSGSGASDL
jgi:hypothetical protein